MGKKEYVTIPQLAKILGISRIAVYKKVKAGEIKALRIGRIYAIPKRYLDSVMGKALGETAKKEIDKAIRKTIEDYGEVLRLLGQE
jgi:excisionase family DNA binding protein